MSGPCCWRKSFMPGGAGDHRRLPFLRGDCVLSALVRRHVYVRVRSGATVCADNFALIRPCTLSNFAGSLVGLPTGGTAQLSSQPYATSGLRPSASSNPLGR